MLIFDQEKSSDVLDISMNTQHIYGIACKKRPSNVDSEEREVLLTMMLMIEHAILYNVMDVFEFISASGFDLKGYQVELEKKEDRISITLMAVYHQNINALKYLYEYYGFDMNTENSIGKSPIIEAAALDSLEIFKYLVENCGCDYLQENRKGVNAMCVALANENLSIMKYINEDLKRDLYKVCISYGEKIIDIMMEMEDDNLFVYMLENYPCELTKLIVDCVHKGNENRINLIAGFNSKLISNCSENLVYWACSSNNLSMVRRMVEDYGHNHVIPDPESKLSPMMNAIKSGNLEIVNYLSQLGYHRAEIGMFDDMDAIAMVIRLDGTIEMLAFLLDHYDYPLDTITKRGGTYVSFAAAFGKKKLMEYLIERGCMISRVTEDGGMWNYALIAACHQSNFDIMRLLHEKYGESLETARSSKGKSLVHLAAMNGNLDILEYLNNKGLEMDEDYDDQKYTPIHFAAEHGQYDCVYYLREKCKVKLFRLTHVEVNDGLQIVKQTPLELVQSLIEGWDLPNAKSIRAKKTYSSKEEYIKIYKYLRLSKNRRNR